MEGWSSSSDRRGCRLRVCKPPPLALPQHCYHRSCTIVRPQNSCRRLQSQQEEVEEINSQIQYSYLLRDLKYIHTYDGVKGYKHTCVMSAMHSSMVIAHRIQIIQEIWRCQLISSGLCPARLGRGWMGTVTVVHHVRCHV